MGKRAKRKPSKIIPCERCGAEVAVYHHLQKHCKKCHTWTRNRRLKKYTLDCKLCGKPFHPRNRRMSTCYECRIEFPCQICGQMTKRTATAQLFCGQVCRSRSVENRRFGGTYVPCLQRDGFKCRKCGGINRLGVHHIDGRGMTSDNPNHSLDNLTTLCNICHHRLHGYTRRTLYEWHSEDYPRVLKMFLGSH